MEEQTTHFLKFPNLPKQAEKSPRSRDSPLSEDENCQSTLVRDEKADKTADKGRLSKPNTKKRAPRAVIKGRTLEILKTTFCVNPKPSRQVRERLCQETNLSMRTILVWFQHRRSKERWLRGCQSQWQTAASSGCQSTTHPSQDMASLWSAPQAQLGCCGDSTFDAFSGDRMAAGDPSLVWDWASSLSVCHAGQPSAQSSQYFPQLELWKQRSASINQEVFSPLVATSLISSAGSTSMPSLSCYHSDRINSHSGQRSSTSTTSSSCHDIPFSDSAETTSFFSGLKSAPGSLTSLSSFPSPHQFPAWQSELPINLQTTLNSHVAFSEHQHLFRAGPHAQSEQVAALNPSFVTDLALGSDQLPCTPVHSSQSWRGDFSNFGVKCGEESLQLQHSGMLEAAPMSGDSLRRSLNHHGDQGAARMHPPADSEDTSLLRLLELTSSFFC